MIAATNGTKSISYDSCSNASNGTKSISYDSCSNASNDNANGTKSIISRHKNKMRMRKARKTDCQNDKKTCQCVFHVNHREVNDRYARAKATKRSHEKEQLLKACPNPPDVCNCDPHVAHRKKLDYAAKAVAKTRADLRKRLQECINPPDECTCQAHVQYRTTKMTDNSRIILSRADLRKRLQECINPPDECTCHAHVQYRTTKINNKNNHTSNRKNEIPAERAKRINSLADNRYKNTIAKYESAVETVFKQEELEQLDRDFDFIKCSRKFV